MSPGRILLADDEPVFLESTADLLRGEGYDCEIATDSASALALVKSAEFDLLITDLEMPGNTDMSLVRSIAATNGGLPCIVVTGFPSVRSAVSCIELPVAAYLTKPVDFPDLRSKVDMAITRYRTYQSMRQAETRLAKWRSELQGGPDTAPQDVVGEVDMFLTLALRNVMATLTDLTHLGRALTGVPVGQHACQLMNCPRGLQLSTAIKQTVLVIEHTKGSFKSRELGDLRKQLEFLMEQV